MPDKGIQIVIALLEKRESFLITKDSNPGFVKEILRAERLGYVQKEEKSAKYTLSEKGCRWVYSGFADEDLQPAPQIIQKVPKVNSPVEEVITLHKPALIKDETPQPVVHLSMVLSKSDLRPAYASSFLITSLFLLTIWIMWVLDLV
jgi:hypothetical protein